MQGSDGWYYYAVLDSRGEYTPSSQRVSVDTPPEESSHLDRAPDRKATLDSTHQSFAQKVEEATVDPQHRYKIGLVLVEFSDTTHYESDDDGPRPNGYFTADFENMFFSEGHFWEGDSVNSPHPEKDQLFGSFRDYLTEQSRGVSQPQVRFDDDSEVINPSNPDGTPQWYQLEHTRTYYDTLGGGRDYGMIAILNEVGAPIQNYTKVGIIYAGPNYYGTGGLWPHATSAIPYKFWIAGEQYFGGDNENNGFNHIGDHAHEFAHLIGLDDTYNLAGEGTAVQNWSLMAAGYQNGPKHGACPASLNAYYRSQWRGVSNVIDSGADTLDLFYNYTSRIYFKIPVANSEQYYLLETRLRDGFDLWTPIDPEYDSPYPDDPNGNAGGLLIWHVNPDANTYDGESRTWN